MRLLSLLLLLGWLVGAIEPTGVCTPSNANDGTCSQQASEEDGWSKQRRVQEQCQIVVAPSTIPGAGLGAFSTVIMKAKTMIGFGDMVIPIPRIPSSLLNPLEDYTWHGRIYKGTLDAYSPGIQSLTNSNLALLNVQQVRPAANVFPDTVDSTPFHYLQTMTDIDVPAGGELFSFYGDHWFEGRPGRFDAQPKSDDYPKAEKLTKWFHQHMNELEESGQANDENWRREYWSKLTRNKQAEPYYSLLPSYEQIQTVVEHGIRHLHQADGQHDLAVLTGPQARCLDMIRPGLSTVHNLGAFSTRPIEQGTIITGSPLLHTSKVRWNEYGQVWDSFTRSYKKSSTNKESYALIMNYCWGHAQSSMLLCPYTVGVPYINHNAAEPNVKIQWAKHGQISHNETWLDRPVKELIKTTDIGLAMDYVALRDIQPGEELFVDYGEAWERAHNAYLWTVPKAKANIDEYNAQNLLLTESEQVIRPYPDNLELGCHSAIMGNDLGFNQVGVWERPGTTRLQCQVLERQQHPTDTQIVMYAVRVFFENTWRGRAGIPREFIKFFDKQGPHHKPFRYEMQIPDDMFPQKWKDLK